MKFLRAHFLIPKTLLSLKVYDIFNMQINIVKRHPFSLLLLKGKKNAIHFIKGQKGCSTLLKLFGGNSDTINHECICSRRCEKMFQIVHYIIYHSWLLKLLLWMINQFIWFKKIKKTRSFLIEKTLFCQYSRESRLPQVTDLPYKKHAFSLNFQHTQHLK